MPERVPEDGRLRGPSCKPECLGHSARQISCHVAGVLGFFSLQQQNFWRGSVEGRDHDWTQDLGRRPGSSTFWHVTLWISLSHPDLSLPTYNPRITRRPTATSCFEDSWDHAHQVLTKVQAPGKCSLCVLWLFVTPWTVAHKAPLSMEFSRHYWSGLPFPSPGDVPTPGIKTGSPALQVDSLPYRCPHPPTLPHLPRYCIHGFNQPGMENIWEKILENSRKHNLNLPHTSNCLYNSYMENSAVTTGLEKVSFHPNPKEEQCHRMFKLVHDCTHFTCKQESEWKSLSRVQLCNPMACNLPGSSVHGILQARILEWVASPIPRGSSKPKDQTQVSHIAGGFFTIWATKVMFKILQARLQQYVNQELPDIQAGFRKGTGTRDQIAIIHWVREKAREFRKNIYFWFIDYAKACDCVDHNKRWKNLKEMGIPDHLTCLLRNLYGHQEERVRTRL